AAPIHQPVMPGGPNAELQKSITQRNRRRTQYLLSNETETRSNDFGLLSLVQKPESIADCRGICDPPPLVRGKQACTTK
ncbi:MAG TPA: hypothetical protein VE242_09465, partial [Chthoniobacterales bacterium]|nr:hypothetical protein [Chthoniobacterales bacterium]